LSHLHLHLFLRIKHVPDLSPIPLFVVRPIDLDLTPEPRMPLHLLRAKPIRLFLGRRNLQAKPLRRRDEGLRFDEALLDHVAEDAVARAVAARHGHARHAHGQVFEAFAATRV